MKTQFEYHRPASLPEACALLLELGSEALPLAGGTDVLVDLRRGSRRPRHLVSLADLEELRGISATGGGLTVGALVTPSQIEASEVVSALRPELLDATRVFGSPQIRRRATLGGNLCTAASCGDLAPILMVLGARVELAGPEVRREVPLGELFLDHRGTMLRPGELLVSVTLPARAQGEGAAYQAFGLRAENAITVAGVAAFLRLERGTCTGARVALGAVSPTPLMVPAAGECVVGREMDEAAILEAARAARAAAAPISDVRGSAEHRRELVEALCERALKLAWERAR